MAATTTVRLAGGIGNQLFQIAAGLSYSKFSHRLVKFVVPTPGSNPFGHVQDSHFFSHLSISPAEGGLVNSFVKVTSTAFRALPGLAVLSSVCIPKEIGFSESVFSKSNWRELRGYFQSYRYVDSLGDEFVDLITPVSNSKWCQDQLDILKSHGEVVSIHIRRGDFKNLSAVHGLLDNTYYREAITEISNHFSEPKFWVFSDDITSAKSLLSDMKFNFYFVEPAAGTPASESITLMASCEGHILANSTFSWWGAYLARNKKIVIAPNEWMRNGVVIRDLCPDNWVRVKSSWVN